MQIRIFKIQGVSERSRERHLERVCRWMEQRDWQLVDYSEEAGSAMFERAEGAPAPGLLDPTRWLPGPDWFQPGAWLGRLRFSPRQLALGGAVGLAVVVAFGTLLNFTVSPTAARKTTATQKAGETWLYVSADYLNLRAEPKTGARIIGVFFRNQRVMVEKDEGGWMRVLRPDYGYVAGKFLKEHPIR